MLKSPWLEITAAALVVVAALIYAAGPDAPAFGSCADWASAIATTAAACVALWLGLSETRRRAEQRKETATFLTLAIGEELRVIDATLSGCGEKLARIVYTSRDPRYRAQSCADLADIAQKLQTPLVDRVFDTINALEKKDAKTVTLIYGQVVRLRRVVQGWSETFDINVDNEKIGNECLKKSAVVRDLIKGLPFAATTDS